MNIKNRLRFKQDIRRFVLFVFVCSISLLSNAQRVYINPGHGDWGPNSRPMATVNYAAYDTLGFFESNTNLWKAFALQEKLVAAGYDVMMSRAENGPYPYVYGDESIDKPLLDICAEVNIFEADYFISIHSNANVDGDNVNYPLFLYAGTDGGANNISNSYSMAQTAWPRHFEAFGNDKNWQTITHGFEPNSYYSLEEPNLRGDESFYGGNGLQVLEHSCPGYLVEGYFHTYQPARHRALNPEWCRQEGIRYFRGIQDYYRKAGENVGYIMGCVRSLTEMSHHLSIA
ncbi:MAG: N-acetylmuramoyl-L-alanine amidase [Paludibacteraceae bacterium]|nr:N-acetylmuramoyl-L-alanine amidase [Paludibacteraceae bacterium]